MALQSLSNKFSSKVYRKKILKLFKIAITETSQQKKKSNPKTFGSIKDLVQLEDLPKLKKDKL